MRNPQALDDPSGRIYFRWQEQFHEAIATVILLMIVFFMFCAVFWLTTHYAKPVEGSSMQPSINNYSIASGDIAIVSSIIRYSYDDIIIVDMEKTDSTDSVVAGKLLIKRVMALAGDTLKLQQNGGEYVFYLKKKGSESYIPLDNPDIQALTSSIKAAAFWSQSNWTHRVPTNADGSITIPEGMIFFAGDNRNASYDCRDFGPTVSKGVVGVVESILTKDSFWNKIFSVVTLFNVKPIGGV